jgi:hypothetical protein
MCGDEKTPVTFLPRFTTLVGATSYTTSPMDATSRQSVQLQVWRGEIASGGADGTFSVFVEESLDAENWTQGPSAPVGYDPGDGEAQFFDYCFRLKWFRLRVELGGTDPIVTCWAEGFLR